MADSKQDSRTGKYRTKEDKKDNPTIIYEVSRDDRGLKLTRQDIGQKTHYFALVSPDRIGALQQEVITSRDIKKLLSEPWYPHDGGRFLYYDTATKKLIRGSPVTREQSSLEQKAAAPVASEKIPAKKPEIYPVAEPKKTPQSQPQIYSGVVSGTVNSMEDLIGKLSSKTEISQPKQNKPSVPPYKSLGKKEPWYALRKWIPKLRKKP